MRLHIAALLALLLAPVDRLAASVDTTILGRAFRLVTNETDVLDDASVRDVEPPLRAKRVDEAGNGKRHEREARDARAAAEP